jgi:DNA-binding XRE family transcriptional regulator
MIRTEAEYKVAVKRLESEREALKRQEAELKKHKLKKDQIQRVMDPLLAFHKHLQAEVEWYENAKRQHFVPITALSQVGQVLIALRIAAGLSQKDLAQRLDIPESQVSRDERNEYHGISLERAEKILAVFGAHIRAEVDVERPLTRARILASNG